MIIHTLVHVPVQKNNTNSRKGQGCLLAVSARTMVVYDNKVTKKLRALKLVKCCCESNHYQPFICLQIYENGMNESKNLDRYTVCKDEHLSHTYSCPHVLSSHIVLVIKNFTPMMSQMPHGTSLLLVSDPFFLCLGLASWNSKLPSRAPAAAPTADRALNPVVTL